jgi:hypothetical protein
LIIVMDYTKYRRLSTADIGRPADLARSDRSDA